MRFLFVDEAGTSEGEPFTLVVGVVVHADHQVMFTQAAIAELLGCVPEQFRKDFVFHAAQVWGDEKYRKGDVWTMADRLYLLKQMMALPRRIGLPISFSLARRHEHGLAPEILQSMNMTATQFDHYMAFKFCVARADKWIRDNANPNEVGLVVAEDVPDMRRNLRLIPRMLREDPMNTGRGRSSLREQQLGHTIQQSDTRVTRIRDVVHFIEKADDPLLYLADACAFGLRRFFCEQEFGDDFATAIFGRADYIKREDWAGPLSATTINFRSWSN